MTARLISERELAQMTAIARDALDVGSELFQTHSDPHDAGYRLNLIAERFRKAVKS